MAWVQIAIWVGTLIVSHLLMPSPETRDAESATLADVQAPTADEKRPIPVLFGTKWVKGANCVWYGDFRSRAIKERVSGGGLF